MEMYDDERSKALEHIRAVGRDENDFAFSRTYHTPDPDGGGMFTIRYDVEIINKKTAKSLVEIGGIGFDWVGNFEEALKEGHFD